MVLWVVGLAMGLVVVGSVIAGVLVSQLAVYYSERIIALPSPVSASGTAGIEPFQVGLFPTAHLHESTFSLRVWMFVVCFGFCRIVVHGFRVLMAETAYFGCPQD